MRKVMLELSTISVDILVEQRTHCRMRRGLSRSARNSGGNRPAPARVGGDVPSIASDGVFLIGMLLEAERRGNHDRDYSSLTTSRI
jgi:hypothetical protein